MDQNNLERLASEKMSQMSFINLMSLISSYKAINMITPSNPLYKYLCYYAPYRPKINQKEQKVLLNENQNYASMTNAIKNLQKLKQINQSIKLKEKTIEFNFRLNKGLQRFQKVEINLRNAEYNKIVILIQKHIRSFIKRIAVIRVIDSIIIEKCLTYIIRIQDTYRKFYFRRNFKVNHIINKILNYRKEKSNQLKKILLNYETKVHSKKEMIIKEILKERHEKICFIQKMWRNKLYRDKILKTIQNERNQYIITYPYYARKVQLKICFDQRQNQIYKTYNFDICSIRKVFTLHINYSDLNPGKYYCQLLVDNYITNDRRFPSIEGKDNQIYNIIDFNQNGFLNQNDNNSYKTGTSSYNLEALENPNIFNFNAYSNYYYNPNSYYNNNYYNYNYNGNNGYNNFGYVKPIYQKNNYYKMGMLTSSINNYNYNYYNNNQNINDNNNYYNNNQNINDNNNYINNNQNNNNNDFNYLKRNLTGYVTEFSN